MRAVLHLLPYHPLFSSKVHFVCLKIHTPWTRLETSAPPPSSLLSSAFEFQVLAQHLRRAILFRPNPGREQFREISLRVSTLIPPLPRFHPLLSFPPPSARPARPICQRSCVQTAPQLCARSSWPARGAVGPWEAGPRGLPFHWLASGHASSLLATTLPVARAGPASLELG